VADGNVYHCSKQSLSLSAFTFWTFFTYFIQSVHMTNEKLNVIIKRQTLAAAAAADDAERDVGRRSVT